PGPRRHSGGSGECRAVLLFTAFGLCDRRSLDLRRRIAFLMCRILVADDNWQQLDLRKLLLEQAGHQVAVAWSVSETMRQVELGNAELVIMDLRFPNAAGEPDASEGLALIRRIREGGCRIPLIVLSGW